MKNGLWNMQNGKIVKKYLDIKINLNGNTIETMLQL